MGKESGNNSRSHSRPSKPYDVSHSFVRKVADRVSGYFGGLFSTPEIVSGERPSDVGTSMDNPQTNSPVILSTEAIVSNNHANRLVSGEPANIGCQNSQVFETTPKIYSAISGPSTSDSSVFRHGEQSTLNSITHKFKTFEPSNKRRHNLDERLVTGSPAPQRQFTRTATPDDDASASRPRKLARLGSSVVDSASGARDDGSDSSESTSGCSSLVPQADRLSQSALPASASRRKSFTFEEKINYGRHLKSLRPGGQMNRSIPASIERPHQSRTSSFDVSAYGRPIMNKSVRETMLTSPFYTGQTTYGGASARRSCLSTSLQSNTPRTSFAVKPADPSHQRQGVMSQTAKRILAALEEFSTPLNDAKRIPSPALATKRRASEVSTASLKRQPLAVPTVADILKLRQLEQMRDSTSMARELAVPTRDPSPPRRRIGKVVTKLKDRDKLSDDPAPPPLDLPSIPLQMTSLPKFDLNLPLIRPDVPEFSKCQASKPDKFKFSPPSVVLTKARSAPSVSSSNSVVLFQFSPPMPISNWSKPTASSENAELSKDTSSQSSVVDNQPLAKEHKLSSKSRAISETLAIKETPSIGFGDKFKSAAGSWECNSCMLRNSPNTSICAACEAPNNSTLGSKLESSKDLNNAVNRSASRSMASGADSFKAPLTQQTGAVLTDLMVGFGDKFKQPAGTWSCGVCLVTNPATASKCIACESKKPGPKQGTDIPSIKYLCSGIIPPNKSGDPFPSAAGSWYCAKCSLSNAAAATMCSTCEAKKPGAENNDVSSKITSGTAPVSSSFGDKFKPAAGSWCCSECLISNSATATKCAACDTNKPGTENNDATPKFSFGIAPAVKSGFGDQFKPSAGSWSCKSCFVSNEASSTKCVACVSPKPGSIINGPTNLSDLWKCTVCLISNKETAGQCAACSTPRSAAANASEVPFSFGLPPGGGFKFGIDKDEDSVKSTSNGPSGTVSERPLGIPADENKKPVTFQFGIPPKKTAENTDSSVQIPKVIMMAPKPAEVVSLPTPATFTFGVTSSTGSTNLTFPPVDQADGKSQGIVAPVSTNPAVEDSAPKSSAQSVMEPSSSLFAFGEKKGKESSIFAGVQNDTGFSFGTNVLTSGFPTSAVVSQPAQVLTPFSTSVTGGMSLPFSPTPSAQGALASGSTDPFVFGSSESIPAFSTPSSAPAFSLPKRAAFETPALKPPLAGTTAAHPPPGSSFGPPFGSLAVQAPSFGGTAVPNLDPNNPAPPTFGLSSSTGAFGASQPTAGVVPNFGATGNVLTSSTFGASTGTVSPSFGIPMSNSPFSTATTAPTPFSWNQSFSSGTPFQASTFSPAAAAKPQPYQFGTPTPNTGSSAGSNFTLNVPSSFNFSGGQNPTFSAPAQSSAGPEPRRRIIQAKRRNPR